MQDEKYLEIFYDAGTIAFHCTILYSLYSEEDQSVMKKDLKSFEVAGLDTTPKQNLDRNAHINGNNYETIIFVVLGICLAFIVLIGAVHVLLSRFYPDFLETHFTQIVSRFYPDLKKKSL